VGLSLWAALAVAFLPGCIVLHMHHETSTQLNPGDQPDKILYERATAEIQRARYDVGRLTLADPDQYLSRQRVPGQSEAGYRRLLLQRRFRFRLEQPMRNYKDFITFFPTAPEAPEAQFRVGMAHYRMMAKADRDRVEARLAEAELKEFLLKYPDNRLKSRVKNRCARCRKYWPRGMTRSRSSITSGVSGPPLAPLPGDRDGILTTAGRRLSVVSGPVAGAPEESNEAVPYYDRILKEHPLSERVEDAKGRLTAMKQPIPRPTKAILARAEADALHHKTGSDPLSKLGE